MPKKIKNAPPASSPWDSEVRLLAWLATCVSVISFLYYFQHGDVLLYGDAVAHINIARRVFDSKTPGLLQLGTVWLPLPHLLMIPFLLSKEMWQRGVGGSIPSMVAYVFGVIGIFRLVRGALSRVDDGVEPDGPARVAAWTAAVVFAANPNLIYMQTTRHGRGALSRPLHLGCCVPDRILARRCQGPHQVRPLSRWSLPHALRRMVPRSCHRACGGFVERHVGTEILKRSESLEPQW